MVAAAKPRPSPHVQMNARHVVRDGRLVLEDFLFEMAEGILGRPSRIPGSCLRSCNSTEHGASARFCSRTGRKALPRGFRLTDFADLVSVMLERGSRRGCAARDLSRHPIHSNCCFSFPVPFSGIELLGPCLILRGNQPVAKAELPGACISIMARSAPSATARSGRSRSWLSWQIASIASFSS